VELVIGAAVLSENQKELELIVEEPLDVVIGLRQSVWYIPNNDIPQGPPSDGLADVEGKRIEDLLVPSVANVDSQDCPGLCCSVTLRPDSI
jgi:hypothetical protein